MKREDALERVNEEYLNACIKFPDFRNGHEGYAVIKEELDELWEEVKKYPKENKINLRDEATQIAAMALRFMVNLT